MSDHAHSHGTLSAAPTAPHGDRERFSVGGMHCAGCASGLQEALLALPGVQSATVDFIGGMAVVAGSAPAERILEAIDATPRGSR